MVGFELPSSAVFLKGERNAIKNEGFLRCWVFEGGAWCICDIVNLQ